MSGSFVLASFAVAPLKQSEPPQLFLHNLPVAVGKATNVDPVRLSWVVSNFEACLSG
jgi:hypothetical protein